MDLLWTSFLNSKWHDWRGSGHSEDQLDQPDWLPKFLAHWKLAAPGTPSPEELAALKRLRERLHRLAVALAAGEPPSPVELHELNSVLVGGPVFRQVQQTEGGLGLGLVPVRQDWAQVMAEIAASLADTLTRGEGARVRICENPDCLWVFYDDTRSRTKRFCDEKLCGNLIKVRRFRARKRAESGQE